MDSAHAHAAVNACFALHCGVASTPSCAGQPQQHGARAPSSFRAMRVTRLLLSSSVFNRGSFGKPSSMMIALSDRSMLSNWFCVAPRFSMALIFAPAQCTPQYVFEALVHSHAAPQPTVEITKLNTSDLLAHAAVKCVICFKLATSPAQRRTPAQLANSTARHPRLRARMPRGRTAQVDLVLLHAVHVLRAAQDQLGRQPARQARAQRADRQARRVHCVPGGFALRAAAWAPSPTCPTLPSTALCFPTLAEQPAGATMLSADSRR